MKVVRKSLKMFFVSMLLLISIGAIDCVTGYELALSLFYLIPIAWAAWNLGMAAAIFFAVAGGLVWGFADHFTGHPYSHWMLPYWNTGIRLGIFLVTGSALAMLKSTLDEQHALIRELRETFADGWEIGRLFPLCACCNKTRTDAAYIEEVRQFAEKHPHARFVHGICPDCLNASKEASLKAMPVKQSA